jgi:hypothetical protein
MLFCFCAQERGAFPGETTPSPPKKATLRGGAWAEWHMAPRPGAR